MEQRNSLSHGSKKQYDRGCRCAECRQGNTDYHREQRMVRRAQSKDQNDPRHGSVGFYRNHACRCGRCSEAHLATVRREQQRRVSGGAKNDPTDSRHGKFSFYISYGCRCERCVTGAAEYRQKRRGVA